MIGPAPRPVSWGFVSENPDIIWLFPRLVDLKPDLLCDLRRARPVGRPAMRCNVRRLSATPRLLRSSLSMVWTLCPGDGPDEGTA